jgi:hypothetical protein
MTLQPLGPYDSRKTLTSWSWALLEKLLVMQLLNNFLTFYGTWRFITVYTRALTVLFPKPDQSSPYHPIPSLQDPFYIIKETFCSSKFKVCENSFTFLLSCYTMVITSKIAFLTTYPKQFSYPLANSCWLDVKADAKLVRYLYDIIPRLPHTYVVLEKSNTWNRFKSSFL